MTQAPIRKKVWITGGGGAIGSAVALLMAKENWQVFISGRNIESLKAIAKQHGHIEIYPCDITIKNEVKETLKQIGPLDMAILNAGSYFPGPTTDINLSEFRNIMEVNYFGSLNCLENLLPDMKQHGGHIAIVGSLAGYIGLPNASGYGASKAAVISLAESLRAELQDSPVKIQLINPGFVESQLTDKNDFVMPDLVSPQQAAKEIFKGLLSDKFEISFPNKFVAKMKFLQRLPYKLYFPLIKRFTNS